MIIADITLQLSPLSETTVNPRNLEKQKVSLALQVSRLWKILNLQTTSVADTIFGVASIVSLPLFLNSVELRNGNDSYNSSHVHKDKTLDAYFTNVYTTIFSTLIFAFGTLVSAFFPGQITRKREFGYHHRAFWIVAGLSAVSCVIVISASSGSRTPAYLQPVMLNFTLPITVLARFLLLGKTPTKFKGMCVLGILVGLFVTIIPQLIPSLNDSSEDKITESGYMVILWSFLFALGSLPNALVTVFNEKYLEIKDDHSEGSVNIFYYNTLTGMYQLVFLALLFWTDIIPGYGYAANIHDFLKNMKFGFQCVFGGSTCSSDTLYRGLIYVISLSLFNVFNCYVNRYTEGANIVVILQGLQTPLAFIFWTIFRENPFEFYFHPTFVTLFAILGLLILIPFSIAYNLQDERRPPLPSMRDKSFREEPDYVSLNHKITIQNL